MESVIAVLPLLAVLVPAGGALLIACTGERRPNLREFWSVAAGVVMFALIACTIYEVLQLLDERPPESSLLAVAPLSEGGGWSFTLFPVLNDPPGSRPGIELAFRVDAFGLLFASGASLLWVLTSFYSIGYMRSLREHSQTRYYACFALALSATMGVAFAANLFTLFLFYEALTFVTYPLVSHHGTAEAKAGGRKYLIYLLGAAKLLLMAAIILTYNAGGTLEFHKGGIPALEAQAAEHPTLLFMIFALFLFGFAKNALMPLHSWLPAAMVAPTPVSALLHAVAVVKSGVFCTLRVMLFVFGPLAMREIGADQLALVAASVTILLGSLLALGQDNLKARLAFSTVSQLSYIILGAALLNRAGVTGGVAHITNHAVSKIALFLCAGSIYVSAHKTEVSQMSGIGRRMPWTMAAFTLASLSIVGIPGTSGCISKWYLALGSAELHSLTLLGVLMASSLLNAAYLFPVVYKAYFEKASPLDPQDEPKNHDEPASPSHETVREVPWMVVPLAICAAASLLLGLFPHPVLRLAGNVADSLLQMRIAMP